MIQCMDDNPTTYVRIRAMPHGERAQNSPIRVPDANIREPHNRGFQGRQIPSLGILDRSTADLPHEEEVVRCHRALLVSTM